MNKAEIDTIYKYLAEKEASGLVQVTCWPTYNVPIFVFNTHWGTYWKIIEPALARWEEEFGYRFHLQPQSVLAGYDGEEIIGGRVSEITPLAPTTRCCISGNVIGALQERTRSSIPAGAALLRREKKL